MTAWPLLRRADPDDEDEDAAQVPDLSIAVVLLDTIADAAAAAGVAVAGAVILAVKGWYWLDPRGSPGNCRHRRLPCWC
jgi:Co/Zn/Cd efflux system component